MIFFLKCVILILEGAAAEDFPHVETMGEIQKQELASIGGLYTNLSKSTDKVTITLFYYFCENYIILSSTYWYLLNCLCEDPWSWRNSLRKMQPLALEAIRLRSQSTHSYVSVSIIDTVSLTKKTYDRLIGVGVSELPKCFEELAGKQCLFQIRVTSYNFTPHYRTFTVSTKDVDVKTHSAAS